MKKIFLGGGCFWCTEAVFRNLRGVAEVVPGYMGGTVSNPTYEAVCTGTTGHAEVIEVLYDETVIPLGMILDAFFATHDPTTLNRQGNDVGTQYRSVIFYTDEEMRIEAHLAVQRAQEHLGEGKVVVTQVAEAVIFYPAEDYHQNYYENHRDAPYCQLVIDPKIEKVQKYLEK